MGCESRAKTAYQMLIIHWLTKVTDDPVVQGASPINVIGVGSHEDCRNHAARIEEAVVEFDPTHPRHMDVADQAGRFIEMWRCEEIRG